MRKLNSIFLLTVLILPLLGKAQEDGAADTGDAKAEARLARIYSKIDKPELDDEAWNKIAGDKAAESYSIQSGDSLWDISTKLFGSGYYWPKVWQLNDAITNPHDVKVGHQIKFSPGSVNKPPSLELAGQPEAEPEVVAVGDVALAGGPPPNPDDNTVQSGPTVVIPPAKKRAPVLMSLPPSFNRPVPLSTKVNAEGFAPDSMNTRYSQYSKPTALASLISERPWKADGSVIETVAGGEVASPLQEIVVRLNAGAPTLGATYTVFFNRDGVEDPIAGGTIGTEVAVKGEIKITDSVAGNESAFRATVTFAALPIRVEDKIRVGEMVRTSFSKEGAPSTVSARIVDGEYNFRRNFGLHNAVFLNKGASHGLQVGNILSVVKNVRIRNPDSVYKYDPRPIGKLRVAAVGDRVATAVVVDQSDTIFPGDETTAELTQGGSVSGQASGIRTDSDTETSADE
jgi:hypothetical protein